VLAAVLAVAAAVATSPSLTVAELVGQKLVVRMDGTVPSASLLGRARRGEIGGVFLRSHSFDSAAQLRSATRALQRAAASGGRPRLLIAADQEGGPVKAFPWIPPTLPPAQITSEAAALAQGRMTGSALRSPGVNTDFAPVADVPASAGSFIYRQGRAWSFDAATTARLAGTFALALGEGGSFATMKHFPGLGFATLNTDRSIVRIRATRADLDPGLEPYRRAIAARVPLIMLSNAVYDAFDRFNAAGWSRRIGVRLLRDELGFEGVTITDSLDGTAHARGVPSDPLAVKAARAGTDLILITGSEAASRSVYLSVLRAAREGRIAGADLRASFTRILALKART
jgi:beta-N-acetylhexosaminidase